MKGNDIFSHYVIKGKTVKNRAIRSAVNDHLGNLDGTVSDSEIEMYDTLGRGDIGIIITGHISVCPDLNYRADIAQLSVGDDDKIVGLRRIASKIHEYDSLAIAQISLAGPNGLTPFDFNQISTEQMQTIGRWFIDAARRVKKAGFDGVQIHMAHWYFLQAVLNKDLNHRTDCYGNNILLPLEIVDGVLNECGDDFIVMVKMNCHQTEAQADDCEILAEYVDKLMHAGVDLFEISGKTFTREDKKAELYYLDSVKYLREKIQGVTLSLVGGIYNIDAIKKALETTDFVSFGRVLLTQPDFIAKLKAGELKASRCLRCNMCFKIFATKYERCVYGPVIPKLEETFKPL